MIIGYLEIALASRQWTIHVKKIKIRKQPSDLAYLVDRLLKAEQKKMLMLFKVKTGQDPDKFSTASVSLEVGHRDNLEVCVKVTAPLSAAGPQSGATHINKTERLKNA